MQVKILIAFLCLCIGISVQGQDTTTEDSHPGIDPFVPPLAEAAAVAVDSDEPASSEDEISTEQTPDETQSENENIDETQEVSILEENKIEDDDTSAKKIGGEKFYRGKTRYTSNGPDQFGFSYSIGDNDEHTRDEMVTIERGVKSDNEDEDEEDKITARGSYSFISADGFQYTVNYVADGKGYHPQVLVSKV